MKIETSDILLGLCLASVSVLVGLEKAPVDMLNMVAGGILGYATRAIK